jgi:hypothetical protein
MNDPGLPPFENQRSSGQDILLPRKVGSRHERMLLVEISSRDRNIVSYPTPSVFRWKFQRPMKDIKSVTLVGATIPNRIFNLDVGWNSFTFQEATVTWTVTLTPGIYTTTTLASSLQGALNTLSGVSNTYVCSILSATDQLKISTGGTAPFSLLFASGQYVDQYENNILRMMNSPARMMGFLTADYTSDTKQIISPFAADCDFLTNRIYLYLNQDNNFDMITTERTSGRKGPFTILYPDPGVAYTTVNKNTYEFAPIYLSSPAPIARLINLDIALRDEFYRPLNLNGRDFTLVLEVLYLE